MTTTIEKLWNILGDESFYNDYYVQVSDKDKCGDIYVIADSWATVEELNKRLGCEVDSLDGIEQVFSDDHGVCEECNQCLETQPSHHSWTPQYCSNAVDGGDLICLECCICDVCTLPDRINEDRPVWVEPLDVYTCKAVLQGGCASGAYMPAVLYHNAAKMMAEYGDYVLEFIEDSTGEVPNAPSDSTWSQRCVFYMSYSVELWVSKFAEELENYESD